MKYTLIIAEKPTAANKIATALAEGKAIKENLYGAPYYRITRGKKDIVVACAVGHLYGLDRKAGEKKWAFPVFDIEWQPSFETRKTADFSKKYLQAIIKLAKDADEFVVATDLDTEGEVIGLNIIKYACKKKDAHRMKFSTLTKEDLIESFENRSKTIEWGLANAGEARHFLDWYNGINFSRALTHAYKTTGGFKILSIGRVQGPALKIIVDRENEINAFKSVPYWQIELDGNVNKGDILALHIQDKFWDKKEADKVMKNVKGQKKGVVDKVENKQFKQAPPNPFDLTAMQIEAYRLFRIQPKDTLAIAQELYTAGYISYPRTSSNQLTPKIGYSKVLSLLSKQQYYSELCGQLLKQKKLEPNNGKKTDPAHPAIYPTGLVAEVDERAAKIYDLIVRRFMATFGEPAVRETMKINVDVNKEIFVAKGTRTVEKGWFVYYGNYVRLEEEELPHVKEKDIVKVKKITMYDKETLPPKRYTPASIIKALENKGLGTKCLTSNTLVKVNSNNQIHNVKISELFDSLYSDFPLDKQGMKIAINNKKTCFSFSEFDEVKSYFKLVTKRKLNKNEKVYRIEYKDGTSIEATGDHPFLIYKNKRAEYIRVKDLKRDMKSIASIKCYDKIGNEIYSWLEFLKKCNKKSSLYGDYNIKKNRKNVSQLKFGKRIGLPQSSICLYEKSKNIPLYLFKTLNLDKPNYLNSENKNLKIKNPFPLRLTSPLARILAKFVGDASIDKEKIRRENCYDFRYHNTDLNLINQFINDIYLIFGIKLEIKVAKKRKNQLQRYYVRIPAVIGRILSILFEEVIEKNATKILKKEFYPEFIGALFDDEGHCGNKEKKIFISNTNFRLLGDVKKMLDTLGIESKMNEKQFKLYIRKVKSLDLFFNRIPFISMKKKGRLINLLYKENILSKDFMTKTISLIKQIDYGGYVFDITNNSEMPNFILSNGVVVHNSTRASIVDTLFQRNYVHGTSSIQASELGINTMKTLEKYVPKIIDEELTRHFENEMEEIREGKKDKELVLSEAKKDITNIIEDFRKHENEIGESLKKAHWEAKDTMSTLGACPNCKGGILMLRKGKFGNFAACNKYPECKTTYSLPNNAIIKPSKNVCKTCGMPMVLAIKSKKRPMEFCLNRDCKSKDMEGEAGKLAKDIAKGNVERKCPKCKKGDIVLRKSIYGSFLGCSLYPKCKHTEKLENNSKPDEKPSKSENNKKQ